MTTSSGSKKKERVGSRSSFLRKHGGLLILCSLFLLLAWSYGLIIPAFENLDEIEHFSAIRFVAETGGLPVHDPALQENYRYRQEASQPPLYYMLMGGVVRLLRLPTADTNSYFVANPFVACGPSDQSYNRNTLYHNPVREGFSLDWRGALLTLHILRALASVLQLVTVLGVYAMARLVFSGPDDHPGRTAAVIAPLAAALTAFNPQFLSVASGVNNDNLVVPLATLGLYLALVTYRRGPSFGRSLGMGLLAGLAGLSKLSGLLLLVPVGLILLVTMWRSRRAPGRIRSTLAGTAAHGLLAGAGALLVSGWWFWRNWQLYQDPTALEPMLKLVGRRETFVFPLAQSGLLFRSFWGQMACTFFSDPFYVVFSVLTGAGLLGLCVAGLRSRRQGGGARGHWPGLFWLALWFGIVLAGWVRWDLLTPAPGGRLLFPAIGSFSILLAYGLVSLWPVGWRRWVAAAGVILLAAVALAALRWEIYPLFSAPRTFDADAAPPIASPLHATFAPLDGAEAPQLALLGYEAAVGDEGSWLDLTLYWQALAPMDQDYALAIQLASPVPGDETLRFNYNTWPGRGNFPTTAWPPGRIIADRYHFNLPANEAQLQAWQLLVAFYETESGERLRASMDGQDVGGALALATLRVPGRTPECPAGAAWGQAVLFGTPSGAEEEAVIQLAGAALAPAAEAGPSTLRVTLCWESLAPAALDYTVFVHLYDAQGELVATGDGQPLNGAYPTHLWRPGDRIVDVHLLAAPSGDVSLDDGYQVGVGLYDLGSGLRLRALQAGRPVANDVVLLRP